MNVDGKVAIVTGAGSGIGRALARRLADAGAKVVAADLNGAGAQATAESIGDGAVSFAGDISDSDVIADLITRAESEFGPVDLYCANAGIGAPGLVDTPEADWERAIDVNLMSHIRAARILVPAWLDRGSGYFVATASAAGVLSQIGSAPYSVTKHGAVAFAEWLSITYGDRGIGVSCLCPMGVNTNMLNTGLGLSDDAAGEGRQGARVVAAAGDILEPEDVADVVLAAIEQETFLILPHAEVLEFMRRKTSDYDRWIRGMRRLQSRVD